jgi:hypothetical protein
VDGTQGDSHSGQAEIQRTVLLDVDRSGQPGRGAQGDVAVPVVPEMALASNNASTAPAPPLYSVWSASTPITDDHCRPASMLRVDPIIQSRAPAARVSAACPRAVLGWLWLAASPASTARTAVRGVLYATAAV